MKKLYEIFTADEWNNFVHIGFFDNLADASRTLKPYIASELELLVQADEIKIIEKESGAIVNDIESIVEISPDFIKEYPSTFDYCIDIPFIDFEMLNDSCIKNGFEVIPKDNFVQFSLCIRGFIHELPDKIVDAIATFYKENLL